MAASCDVVGHGVRPAIGVVAVAALALVGFGGTAEASRQMPTGSTISSAALNSMGNPEAPTVPKVPFGNQPCESLTASDEQALKMVSVHGKPDRAPATLPIDNMCSYVSGGGLAARIGYMTDEDYRFNHDGNQSTSRKAPADLPGAFYDQQGGLWFAKNGYYVVVTGASAFKEPVSHVVAGKL